MRISFEKPLTKLYEKGLFDGRAWTVANGWWHSYILTSSKDYLVLTPFFCKNNPNTDNIKKINKADIESMSGKNSFFTGKRIYIKLKDGKTIKYATRDEDIESRMLLFQDWLSN